MKHKVTDLKKEEETKFAWFEEASLFHDLGHLFSKHDSQNDVNTRDHQHKLSKKHLKSWMSRTEIHLAKIERAVTFLFSELSENEKASS